MTRAGDGPAFATSLPAKLTEPDVHGKTYKQFAMDLFGEIKRDNVPNGAAALAFFLMLAIFPALIALLTILPYLPFPNLEGAIMSFLGQALPGEAAHLIQGTLRSILSHREGGLLTFGLVLALWSAANGIYAVMRQLNVTYHVEEGRSFIKARTTAFLLMLMFGALVIVAFALVIFGGMVQSWLASAFGWSMPLLVVFAVIRWVIILAGLLLALALMYYFGPDVEQRFRYVTLGSMAGVVLLCGGALVFRVYVSNFANFSVLYGSLGGLIMLLFWLYLVGWVILLGAEINALIEHYSPEGKVKGEKSEPSQPRRGAALHGQE